MIKHSQGNQTCFSLYFPMTGSMEQQSADDVWGYLGGQHQDGGHYDDLTKYAKAQYNKIRNLTDLYVGTHAAYATPEVKWLIKNDIDFVLNVHGWQPYQDKDPSALIVIDNLNDAMRFKLAFLGIDDDQ